MDIKTAILKGVMCEDCIYYEDCYYDRDCIAMDFLKKVARLHDKLIYSDNTDDGDQ